MLIIFTAFEDDNTTAYQHHGVAGREWATTNVQSTIQGYNRKKTHIILTKRKKDDMGDYYKLVPRLLQLYLCTSGLGVCTVCSISLDPCIWFSLL
jgi:hypothetical protein